MQYDSTKAGKLTATPRCHNRHLLVAIALLAALLSLLANVAYANEKSAREREITRLQIRQAANRIEQGQISIAVDELHRALKQARLSGDIANQVATLGVLSDGRLVAGLSEQALELAREAVTLSAKLNQPALKANALNYLGNAYVAQSQFEQAQQSYQAAALLAQQTGDSRMAINLSINQLHVLLNANHVDVANPLLEDAFTKVRALPSQEQLYDLITLGHLAQRLLQQAPSPSTELPTKPSTKFSTELSIELSIENMALKKAAFDALSKAKTLALQQQDKPAESMAVGYLAELYAMDHRYREAEQLFRQALFLSLESNTRYLSGRWHWQLGHLLAQTQRKPEAIAAYFEALAMLKTIQPVLLQGWRGYPNAFRDSVGVVYRQLAQLLLEKASQSADAASRQSTLKSIRTVMEEYKAVEMKEYFQDACVTEQLTKNQHIELDDLITAGTAVLYPVVFADHTVLLLSQANGDIHSVTVDINQRQIEQEARAFRALMNPSSNPRQMLKLAMSLYDKLIRPVHTQLQQHQVNQLVIVPEGVLRTIPFAALHDGEHYLVNQYALAISPGLLLTDTSLSNDDLSSDSLSSGLSNDGLSNRLSNNKAPRIFSAGLSEGVQGFSQLPYVRPEIENIAELYNSKKILNKNFTKSNVLSELSSADYEWVTFSTHSYIDRNFNQSFLLTYDNKLTFDELETAFQSGRAKNQNVDLLVLSACETAVGDERAALGLAGLALKAGVKSTMASLWTVNDQYSSILVPEFLSQLKHSDVSKAQALQAAQLQLINEYQAIHPYYWAAFVIAGNWL